MRSYLVAFFAVTALALASAFAAESGLTSELPIDWNVNFPTTIEMIESNGYPAESHIVETVDGYLLTMHRIPHGLAAGSNTAKGVVFIQHGLLSSSADWVVIGPENALAYLLADAGYDVWMGNARGNKYSRDHVSLDPDDSSEFWDFSWHEIAIFDLPSMIEYISDETGRMELHYIGHSQGTTALFVMLSLLPEYNDRLLTANALAPVAFMSHLKSPFIRALSPLADSLDLVTSLLGVDEFAPSNEMTQMGGYLLCMESSPIQEVCPNVLFLVCGFDSEQLNRTQLPAIMANVPAGAATKQFVHYGQLVNSGHFRQFDYGVFFNLLKYGSLAPPDYPLDKITAPIGLYFGNNDWLAALEDVDILRGKLSNANIIADYLVPLEKFNHLDFLWAIDVKTLLYNKLIAIIEQYNQ